MRMRKAARAIIVQDGSLLVMRRNKFGERYLTLVGGGVETGETPEQAVVREVREETGLQVTDTRLVFVEDAGEPFGAQYIFLCGHKPGSPTLSEDTGESIANRKGKNLYEPTWLPLAQLPEAPLRSQETKAALIKGFGHGFPDEPEHLQPAHQTVTTKEL
jgi:8-oxo-dGTP diphosphatase